MSIGGTVIETLVCGDRVWIDTKEKLHWRASTAIYVENTPEARAVSPGDLLWWQGGWCYWTPKGKDGKTIGPVEVKLKRRGYSGVGRPTTGEILKPCSRFEASDYENTMCNNCGIAESKHTPTDA